MAERTRATASRHRPAPLHGVRRLDWRPGRRPRARDGRLGPQRPDRRAAELLPFVGGCYPSAGSIPYPPSRTQDALLLEATVQDGTRHLVFTRVERVEKDGLFPAADPFHPRVFPVGAAQLGYLYELPIRGPLGVRVGGALGVAHVPEFIEPAFRRHPVSYWILAQARLR
jgi:hypothetical protein